MTDEKKTIENNFDHMREIISQTKLFINVGDTTVGETFLREGDVFRIATALINEGFRLERKGEWVFKKYVGEDYYKCSCCGQEYPFPPNWCEYDIHEYLKYCSACGARMTKE